MTAFKEKVYALTRLIPRGKVATYAQLALLAGAPGAARAVGTCMRHNPDMRTIPCHRVIASDGSLKGYFGPEGIGHKYELLRQEGVQFKKGRVDLTISQWRPTR